MLQEDRSIGRSVFIFRLEQKPQSQAAECENQGKSSYEELSETSYCLSVHHCQVEGAAQRDRPSLSFRHASMMSASDRNVTVLPKGLYVGTEETNSQSFERPMTPSAFKLVMKC